MTNEIDIKFSDEPTSELIIVKQLPIIEQQLKSIKESFTKAAENALSLECTEDTLQLVKKERAKMTKVYNALEAKRKEAKKSILAPYEAFESVYKECVTEIYAPCDKKLAEKIHSIEDGIKSEKYEIVKTFFDECCADAGIDFVSFEQSGITVTMTASKKSLLLQSKDFVSRIQSDLSVIDGSEDSIELLAEYKKSLNLSAAITTIRQRKKEIEDAKERAERLKQQQTEKTKAGEKIDNVLSALESPEEIEAPAIETIEIQPEKTYVTAFRIYGTLEQLKQLKKFLTDGGYKYEQQ